MYAEPNKLTYFQCWQLTRKAANIDRNDCVMSVV